jgi:hypothetical protein
MLRIGRIRTGVIRLACFAAVLSAAPSTAEECEEHFDSTFEQIQTVIFERRGCTSAICHGASASGGLDLRPEVAYDNLVDQPPQSVSSEQFPGLVRLLPARKDRSLLWLNLAAAVLPEQWEAPLRPMPLAADPLSLEELDLLRMWIEYGAPREGVVPGAGELLGGCLPPPGPLETKPLPPPSPYEGFQLRAPRQWLPANRERETCFVTYYDFTDQVPEQFRGPNGDTFRFKNIEARQDPLSHHAVVIVYEGRTPINSTIWREFRCRGGEREGGDLCDPVELGGCGADSVCASEPVQAVACIGYGPGDASIGIGEKSLFSTMASGASDIEGVYSEAPLKGILVWNSHAFNLNGEDAKLDMWINFEFAAPEEQIRPLERFVDISAIFKMNPPAYGVEEVCSLHVVPRNVRLLDLASHQHKRGARFRVFEGRFTCRGGPNNGAACSPFGPDPIYPVRDVCSGAPCVSRRTPRVGDCNVDMEVSVDELVAGLGMALNGDGTEHCPRFDGNADGKITIDELVAAVDAATGPRLRDPEESLLYTSTTYADPLILALSPPLQLGGTYSTEEERTLTYCGLYDNGFTNPDEVKRLSRVPQNSSCVPTHCAEGRVGERCGAGDLEQRDRSCDSSPDVEDGFCDACSVGFGVTTDDEMFVLTGSYVAN